MTMGPGKIGNDEARDRDNGDGGPEASASTSPRMHVRSASSDVENGQTTLPVWLRESDKSYRWRWIPYRIRQMARSVVVWVRGPDPPQMQKITPFFPEVQRFLVELIDKHLPKKSHKAALLALFYFCWILTFSLVLYHSASAGNIKGYGKPEPVWCGASYWSVLSAHVSHRMLIG